MGEWIRLILAMVFVTAGLFFVISSVIGNYRFSFVLSRMQAAALSDTMGLLLVMLGLAVMNGLAFSSLELLLVVLFQWISSPISSHMLAMMELSIGDYDLKERIKKK